MLKNKIEEMQSQLTKQEKQIRDLNSQRGSENDSKEKNIERLETENSQKDRDLEKYKRVCHTLETRYELLKVKM